MAGQATEYGKALGLNEGFLRQVESQGQGAIISRVRHVDASGAHGRLLSMVQQYGMWLEDQMAEERPIDEGLIGDVVMQLAEMHGVRPELAMRLVGAVMETWQLTVRRLGEGVSDADVSAGHTERASDVPGDGAGA